MIKGILIFNMVLNRYLISYDNGECIELHCGDTFKCSPDLNGWIDVRIEYDNEWYLIDNDSNRISIWENMLVRK